MASPNEFRNVSSLSTLRAKPKTHFLLLHFHGEQQHTHLLASVLTFSLHYGRAANLFTLHCKVREVVL